MGGGAGVMLMSGRTTTDRGSFLWRALFVLGLALFGGQATPSDQTASGSASATQELTQIAVILTVVHDQKARSTLTDDDMPVGAAVARAGQSVETMPLAAEFWVQTKPEFSFALCILPPVRGPPLV